VAFTKLCSDDFPIGPEENEKLRSKRQGEKPTEREREEGGGRKKRSNLKLNVTKQKKKKSLVRERTLPTERPSLVGEVNDNFAT
jgi:hypothetical protein